MMKRACLFLVALSLVACGDDDSVFDAAAADVGTDSPAAMDAGEDAGNDAGPGDDGGMMDAGVTDAGGADAGAMDAGSDVGSDAGTDGGSDAGADAGFDAGTDAGAMDASRPDAGGDCHGYSFGRPVVTIEGVARLPTMTGGAIPRGIYDAVALQTTGTVRGTFRGTWVFEDATTLQLLQQLARAGAPPAPTPRTDSYRTVGTSLQRSRTCGGSGDFNSEYRVREEDGRTFLDVRQDTIMFSFVRR